MRKELERALLRNEVKCLVSTVALGMGFDKPDLGFVVHFQTPSSITAYYQQIGRAGRAVERAEVVLLVGTEDMGIHDHFVRTAFPREVDMGAILTVLERSGQGLGKWGLLEKLNVAHGALEHALTHLTVDGAVVRGANGRFSRSASRWVPDRKRWEGVEGVRRRELDQMRRYTTIRRCLMAFIGLYLDDPEAGKCGRCANCRQPKYAGDVNGTLARAAVEFLRNGPVELVRRQQYISHVCRPGWALCKYADAGWGEWVKRGKYEEGWYAEDLVRAAQDLVAGRWNPRPAPTWVCPVPSGDGQDAVESFARRLALRLGLKYEAAFRRTGRGGPQKDMLNGVFQRNNDRVKFQIGAEVTLPAGPVLLIDDIVNSGWTLAVCGEMVMAKAAAMTELGASDQFMRAPPPPQMADTAGNLRNNRAYRARERERLQAAIDSAEFWRIRADETREAVEDIEKLLRTDPRGHYERM